MALTVAVPFAGIMEESIGNSLEITKLLPAYDHTVWTDFMNTHGDKISGLTSQVRWMVPVFLLAYIFLSGGIVKSFAMIPEDFSAQRFMAACTQYFWRFFRLFGWLLLFQGIVVALLYGGAFFFGLGGDFENLRSEAFFSNAGKIILPIHLFLATFIAMVGDYTKVRMVREDTWFVLREFGRSFAMCLRYFSRTYLVYLLDIVLLVGVYALYLFLAPKIGMTGKAAILIMLIVQTLVMFFRLGTRLFAIASANVMYTEIQQKENPQIVEEIREEEAQNMVAPVPVPVAAGQAKETFEEDNEFDEEDQEYNEREHIQDWTPYQNE